MNTAKAVRLVQSALTPDLLKGRWKKQTHPLSGYCYVASEALWHLLGKTDWKAVCATYSDDTGRATHWWLVNKNTGKIVDPTKEQFPNTPPYHLGRGVAFLTQNPSKRAQTVLNRIQGTN